MDSDKIREELIIDSRERLRLKEVLTGAKTPVINTKDRSLAKTTRLVNRLKKIFTEPTIDSWLEDFSKIELSMYFEEVISALVELYRTVKLRDVFRFIEITVNLVNEYPELGPSLFNSLKKQLEFVMNDSLRLRIHLRTLTEGVWVGVFPEEACMTELLQIFKSVLCYPDKSPQILIVRLTGLSYWVGKYASVLPSSCPLLICVADFYATTSQTVLKAAKSALVSQEAANVSIRIHHGNLDPETEARYLGLQSNLEKLSALIETIRSTMNFPLFEAPIEKIVEETAIFEEEILTTQFCDELEKSMYLDFPNLAERLPKSLLPTSTLVEEEEPVDDILVSVHVRIFLDKLERNCYTQEEADELAIYWFEGGFNSKGNRKILAKWLLIDSFEIILCPAQCRFIATLAPFASDLVSTLIPFLRKAANKIRSIRFLGELAKFGICPPGVILKIFKAFLDDFSPTNGELASWLLIACGRFLLNKPEVQDAMEALTVRLMKLKETTRNLPQKIIMMIDDAYCQAKPKAGVLAATQRTLSPMEQYINFLCHVEVYRMDEDLLLPLLCKLPWNTVYPVFQGALLSGVHMNFDKTYCLASLLAGLQPFEPTVVFGLVDAILEEFQLGLEKEDFRLSSSRVRVVKLIAELYVFRLVDSAIIFDLLYHLIGFRDTSSFGASDPGALRALLGPKKELSRISEDCEETGANNLIHPGAIDEPSWSFVRSALVCTILNTCGEYFLKGKARKRLDRFLVLFQRYLALRGMPLRIQHVVADTFDLLGFKLSQDVEQDFQRIVLSELGVSGCLLPDNSDDDTQISDTVSENVDYVDSDDSDISTTRMDMDRVLFDREMQDLMVDTLAEARTKTVVLNPLLIRSQQPSSNASAGSFKVLRAVGPRSANVSDTLLVVPETHKLRKGQLDYQAEQAEAARERQLVKQYIMQYERHAGGPASASLPTLGEMAGIDEATFDPLRWSDNRKERRRYRAPK